MHTEVHIANSGNSLSRSDGCGLGGASDNAEKDIFVQGNQTQSTVAVSQESVRTRVYAGEARKLNQTARRVVTGVSRVLPC